jgi:Zn-dependent metalloprotease
MARSSTHFGFCSIEISAAKHGIACWAVALIAAIGVWGSGGLARAFAPSATATARRAKLPLDVQNALHRLERRAGGPVRTVVRHAPGTASASRYRLNWASGFRVAARGTDPAARALDFLQTHGELVGVTDPADQLALKKVHRWRAGEVVRFAVVEHGLEVFGHTVVVSLQGDAVTAVAGHRPRIVARDRPQPLSLPAEVSGHVARRTGRPAHRVLNYGYLVVAGEARLVWRADVYLKSPPQRLLLAVDDRTGRVLRVGRGFIDVQGKAYDHSPLTGDPVVVELADLESQTALEGTYAHAYQCLGSMYDWPACDPLQHNATPDSDGDYLYDPVEPSASDMFSEVHAYYHITEFNKWLADYLGFEWTCAGSRKMDVHVNMDYPNAFYGDANGDAQECGDVTLGQSAIDFAYDSQVMFHEFTHGMVDQTARLGCPDWGVCIDSLGINFISLGLNEGFADYFAMTYTDDPDLGAYVATETGDAFLRTALNQNQCPWDVTSESHHDGQIWSGAMWTFRDAFGVEKADNLAYGALLVMPEDAEFAEAGEALIAVAQQMQTDGLLTASEVQLVQTTVGPSDRNMIDCYRIIPLTGRPAGKETAYGYGMETYPGYLDELPVGIQWAIEVPENGQRMTIWLTSFIGQGSSWRVYLKKDDPAWVDVGQHQTSVDADHEFDGSPTWIELSPYSDPPIDPGTTYYMVIVYSGQWGEYFQLSAEVQTNTIEPDGAVDAALDADTDGGTDSDLDAAPDARVDGSVDSDDPNVDTTLPESLNPRQGCNCTTAAAGGGVRFPLAPNGLPLFFMSVLTLAGLLYRRRRRRRCPAGKPKRPLRRQRPLR